MYGELISLVDVRWTGGGLSRIDRVSIYPTMTKYQPTGESLRAKHVMSEPTGHPSLYFGGGGWGSISIKR